MFPLKDTIPSSSKPIILWLIILINTIVFFIELSLPKDVLNTVFYYFGLVPARFSHPDWAYMFGIPADDLWPFLTNIFLHGGWLHFIFNMWTLFIFGDNVEDEMGHFRFLIFYLLCGIIASLTHFVFNLNSTVPAIGASGAIAGVMGAYFLMFPHSRIITLIPILFIPLIVEIPAFFFLAMWFFTQLISGAFSKFSGLNGRGIAWFAHIGGFVAGMLLLPIFRKRKKMEIEIL